MLSPGALRPLFSVPGIQLGHLPVAGDLSETSGPHSSAPDSLPPTAGHSCDHPLPQHEMSLFQLGVRGFALAEELAFFFFFLHDDKGCVADIAL